MQQIRLTDSRLSWPGAIAVQHTANWAMPWRLPYQQLDLFPPADLIGRAIDARRSTPDFCQ